MFSKNNFLSFSVPVLRDLLGRSPPGHHLPLPEHVGEAVEGLGRAGLGPGAQQGQEEQVQGKGEEKYLFYLLKNVTKKNFFLQPVKEPNK